MATTSEFVKIMNTDAQFLELLIKYTFVTGSGCSIISPSKSHTLTAPFCSFIIFTIIFHNQSYYHTKKKKNNLLESWVEIRFNVLSLHYILFSNTCFLKLTRSLYYKHEVLILHHYLHFIQLTC